MHTLHKHHTVYWCYNISLKDTSQTNMSQSISVGMDTSLNHQNQLEWPTTVGSVINATLVWLYILILDVHKPLMKWTHYQTLSMLISRIFELNGADDARRERSSHRSLLSLHCSLQHQSGKLAPWRCVQMLSRSLKMTHLSICLSWWVGIWANIF